MNTGKFIIYGLFDPRDGQLRYIGKTERNLTIRLQHHIHRAFKQKTNEYKSNWIKSIIAAGFEPEIGILEELDTHESLIEAERWNIAYWRSLGCRLVNLTVGGEGALGYKHSEPTRAKISAAKKGKSSHMLGKTHSQETKLKISATKTGVPSGRKGQKLSLENVIKNSRSHGGRPFVDQYGVIYQTQSQAAKAIGCAQARVWAVLSGRQNATKGFVFRYLEQK